MAAHIADLTAAEVPIHIPGEAVHAGAAFEVARVIRVVGGGPDPKIVVEVFGWFARGGEIAGPGELPVAPRGDGFNLSDGAIAYEFANAVEVFVFVALGAALGGDVGSVFQVVGPDDSGFFHAVGEGLFTIDVVAAVHGPVGDERVGVIGGANDNGVDVLLVKALPPVDILLGLGKAFGTEGEVLLVDIAQSDHVFGADGTEVSFASPPGSNQSDVEFIGGGVGPEQGHLRQNCGSESCGG